MRRAARLLAVLTVLLAAVTAASAGPATAEAPPKYFVDETKLPFAPLPGIDTDRYWGVHNGAGYRIEVPRNWNNRLVMWAHGFRGSGLEHYTLADGRIYDMKTPAPPHAWISLPA